MEMDQRTLSQPNSNDKDELEIRKKLENLISTEWAKNFFELAKAKQAEFFKSQIDSFSKKIDPRADYLELIKDLCKHGKTQITSGVEHLEELANKPFILITNHLGTAKLSRIRLSDLSVDVQNLEEIEPFPIRVAPLQLIAEKTSLNLFECAVELPNPFFDIQEKSDVITIPSKGNNRTKYLQEKIVSILKDNSKSLFVMYPEGGTSGKRNHGGPYDLDIFHSGSFVIAKYLQLPILPVFQSFDSDLGFGLRLFPKIESSDLNITNLKETVEKVRLIMQDSSPKIS
ncbi:hypothetical protein A2130_04190 [Candidatus Woesebacteria bacterium GWC2_33_12]|uniref:Phospholipid/glycerol acyltransferase domain-containing protein n=1 Tax=Candidatus Woesebacteria bacterium GW2011_GWB1_33_22 TaxID=1618566 RepID=A0A0F9ZI90_9BACT|nr:MAG: hypothetical protein UR29_C0017G0011 [Candidatus Woesebacteria bacterium GW2011_GWC2_33_12]KKP41482.1 MAG: hypothetical protein UR33_C0015G0021 [Candidatus Woesebacteria bacterium GW2011_GWA2_33_20]KKP43898.1 MAG: hypothetical protein UR35_C0015G0021 [Candidatus Woesebacteria bacterium GW2011_GWB1_33_22]KKP45629.1 MAG: hypothetical protein UR37_C0017G0021 [Microgenomates group bacterium GW2011_GWC1_33_28]KKP49359.1 MAG: hypothetical protein UR41_C0016G0020 [Candidatus Woesebacteria bact